LSFAELFAYLGILREYVQAKTIVLSQNLLPRAIYPAPVDLLLGPLTIGVEADVQLKSRIPIGAKVEISPKC
jgi:hypothetical protein